MNKKTIAVATMIPFALTAAFAAWSTQPAATGAGVAGTPAPASSSGPPTPQQRGKYLVTIAGCNDCHTPLKMGAAGPEPDMTRMLSGHPESLVMPPAPKTESPWGMTGAITNTAWAGPWGVSFTANLTPDKDTGLGKWTSHTFRDAIRNARHQGRGRPILPPMPVAMYKHFTDEDMDAVFAYLQSIPAVRNKVPEPLPPPGAASAAQ